MVKSTGRQQPESLPVTNKYLNALEKNGYKLLGFYQQGSQITGNADEFSDYDFIAIWKNKIPKSDLRKKAAATLRLKTYDFRDIPKVQKSIDAFKYKSKVFNIGHILEKDFFSFHKQINESDYEYLEERLLRLSGFKAAKIILDPTNKLRQYQKTIRVNQKIVKAARRLIKDDLEYCLKKFQESTRRKGVELYAYYLYQIASNLRILLALGEKEFPISAKWYEAERSSELVKILARVEKSVNKEKTTKQILKIAARLGFKPSNKIHA